MRRRDALHFDLVVAIARIDIVELLLTRRTRISGRRGVHRLGNPHDGVFFRNPQPQIVESSPLPSAVDSGLSRSINRHGDDRAEVETVADAAALIVDTGMADRVGIDPASAGIADDLRHSIEHARSGLDIHPRVAEKEDVGIGASSSR